VRQLSRHPLGGHNNSLEDKLKSALLSIAGYYCIAFAIFHTLFWKLFRWKADLQRLSDINRAVMQVLNLCLTFVFLFMGIAVLLYQPDFLGTKLGTYLLVSMAIFWTLRAAEQIIFFDIKNIISSFLFVMFLIGSGLFLIPVL
jgi:hypothetical protein